MSPGGSVVPVHHQNCYEYGKDVGDEGKHEVSWDQWNGCGGGWKDLADEDEENHQGNDNADGQCHFLARVGGQVEHEDAQQWQHHTGHNQVDRIEEGLATQLDGIDDVGVIHSSIISIHNPGGNIHQIPGATSPVVGEIDKVQRGVKTEGNLKRKYSQQSASFIDLYR